MKRVLGALKRRVRAFLERGTTSVRDDADLVLCIRRLNAIVLIGVAATVVYAAQSAAQGFWLIAGLQAGFLVVLVVCRAVTVADPRRRVVPAVHVTLAALTIVLAYSAFYFGPAVTSTFLLALVILVAAYVLGVRAALVWGAISILALAAVTLPGDAVVLKSGDVETTTSLFVSRTVFLLAILGMAVAARVVADRWAAELEDSYEAEARAHEQTRLAKDAAERARAEAEEIGRRLELAREKAVSAEVEAERANAAKSEFLSRVSHELRTPLNAVMGFSQLLGHAELPEREADWAERIDTAGRHLLQLIEELLDISRIETGSLDLRLETVDVRNVVHDVVDLVQPLTAERNVRIVADDPDDDVCVRADRQRLSQVLINLVSNAIKYNTERGTVHVYYSQTGSSLRLCVTDTGVGIAEERVGDLFVPFDRLGAERGEVEGTGIGLAIAQRLIEAMGGAMGVDSKLGQGSTFWIELPRAGTADRAEPATSAQDIPDTPGAPATSHRAVCVEDDPTNAELIIEVLAARGDLELEMFSRGSVALEHLRRRPPDVVLLDAHLPDMDATEIIAAMHEADVTRSVPVVIVSADATDRARSELMRLGAVRYVTKPIDINELLNVIDEVLGKGRVRPWSAADLEPGI